MQTVKTQEHTTHAADYAASPQESALCLSGRLCRCVWRAHYRTLLGICSPWGMAYLKNDHGTFAFVATSMVPALAQVCPVTLPCPNNSQILDESSDRQVSLYLRARACDKLRTCLFLTVGLAFLGLLGRHFWGTVIVNHKHEL